MPGTTEALVKSAAYDGQFFTFGRWRSSKFAVKKLPVGDCPKPVWHSPQSTLYITPFGFTRKMCAKKSVWTYHTLESKLLLSKKSLLIVYQLSDSHSVTKGSARTMTTNTTSWDRAGTAKLAKAVRVFYRYARGWIFFTKWKYDGESTSTVLPIRIWRWQEGGGKMSTARVGFE